MPSVPVQSPAGTTVACLGQNESDEASCAHTISGAIAGDPAAVHALLTRIQPAVVRYCRARVTAQAGHGDADDIAQDICVAILRGLSTFVGAPHQILPWIYGIATQMFIDYDRRSGRDPSAGPEQLMLLTPIQRDVLILRAVVGLSAADTAAVTGLSITSVRVVQHRALNRMRHDVDADGQADCSVIRCAE
jgi:RNA polymerase sigma-70 factor, ECF subfamily